MISSLFYPSPILFSRGAKFVSEEPSEE